MGIENIAREPIISCNQSVMKSPKRYVRLLCEKHRSTSQRQPMRALGTPPFGRQRSHRRQSQANEGEVVYVVREDLSGARMNDGPVKGRNYLPPQARACQRPPYSSL
jgi:hypothetical protein